ncbi:MAG: SAM-dependent methyltransferase [Chromatiaceae bacterium]|nr:SAM-dependent methyltransferase [Chromatiaceae bacterium]
MRVAVPGPGEGEDPVALEHSLRLADLIRAEARASGGALPFDRFMELALYAPGLGYYVAGARKFGRGGDFVTAPAISPLFGLCLARQCREVLAALGGGDILELGAGAGDLAADLLDGLKAAACLPGRYLILEPGPELRERQRHLLQARHPDLMDRIQWLDDLPPGFSGVLVANEVLDALPVQRFQVREGGEIAEILVKPRGAGWEEMVAEPRSPGLTEAVQALWAQGLAQAPGYASEINPRLGPWIHALAASLDRGLMLLIDYGYDRADYYRPERGMGTLMCHYRHQAHGDPYVHLGLQDLTAHVDFSAAASAGRVAGLAVAGFTTQAHFLIALGLDDLLAERMSGDPGTTEEDLRWLLGAKQLVMPSAMGERFRVLGLAKDLDRTWTGFSLRDLRGRL